ncbi:MAG: DNA polymerase III subunit [Firmicutes bacterium]|nr:DNA polymerase III subunit [[Eubacterium] siraeum]MCM1488181.1 DNA polymerase III subunit [Bacillota bacterium]
MKIYGNKHALEQINGYAHSGRLPHSILFFGDSGTGKRTLADYTAMCCFCSAEEGLPCMSCRSCKRIEEHIHPDVICIDCSAIDKESLRNVLKGSFEMPVEGKIRVYIWQEFQLLSQENQNSLLTRLEEPSEKVRFILTSSNKNGVLPTILSRVTIIRTYPLTVSECASALAEMGFDDCERAAEIYGGNLGLALNAARDKNSSVYMETAKTFVNAVCENKEYRALISLLTLPQPKEDKREPLKQTVFAAERLIHDGFAIASGGSGGLGCDRALSKKLSEKYSAAVLNRLCGICRRFSAVTSDVNFNGKITANAFTAAIFGEIAKS